jgi:hypothetical protein
MEEEKEPRDYKKWQGADDIEEDIPIKIQKFTSILIFIFIFDLYSRNTRSSLDSHAVDYR